MEINRPHRPPILDPRSGRIYKWGKEKPMFVDSLYNIGIERMHKIVSELLLKKSYRKRSHIASSNPNTLKRLFRQYDEDNSGSLDAVEFFNMLLDLGLQSVSYKDFITLFKLYDKDNDGHITYDEWCNVHCQHFTDEISILDFPSTRLDITHSSMTPNEALKSLCNEIIKTTREKNIKLTILFSNYYDYNGYVNYIIVKNILRNKLCIGIGNEPALNLLLDRCICYNKCNINYVSIKKINELILKNVTLKVKNITDNINLLQEYDPKPINNYISPSTPVNNKSKLPFNRNKLYNIQ